MTNAAPEGCASMNRARHLATRCLFICGKSQLTIRTYRLLIFSDRVWPVDGSFISIQRCLLRCTVQYKHAQSHDMWITNTGRTSNKKETVSPNRLWDAAQTRAYTHQDVSCPLTTVLQKSLKTGDLAFSIIIGCCYNLLHSF